jgi:tRNA(Ser,Leu) C12 N-acetylase TAN1
MNDNGNGQNHVEWNVLVTAQEGAARDLKRFVRRLGTFRWSGFRNVLLGQVTDPDAFLRALAADIERKPFAQAWLGKVLPIVTTFPVRIEHFLADAESHLTPMVEELKGKSFHVRVERRGHKGALRTHELEQQIGEYLWQRLENQHAEPAVAFKDPDVVIAVEIAGTTAGIAVVRRKLREEFPFVKID